MLLLICILSNSQAQKVKEYWPDGSTKLKGKLKNSHKIGKWRSWYESGELETIGRFKYHPNGFLDVTIHGFFNTGEKSFVHHYDYENRSESKLIYNRAGVLLDSIQTSFTTKFGLNLKRKAFYETGEVRMEQNISSKNGTWTATEYFNSGSISCSFMVQMDSSLLDNLLDEKMLIKNFASPNDNESWVNHLQTVLKKYEVKLSKGNFVCYDGKQNTIKSCAFGSSNIHCTHTTYTDGNLYRDSIYKNGSIYEVWEYKYLEDTLAYRINYYENDTSYIYPIPLNNGGYLSSPTCGDDAYCYGGEMLQSSGAPYMPIKIPVGFPDGHWVRYFDFEHLYLYNRHPANWKLQVVCAEANYIDGFKVGEQISYMFDLPIHQSDWIAPDTIRQENFLYGAIWRKDEYQDGELNGLTTIGRFGGDIIFQHPYTNNVLDGECFRFDSLGGISKHYFYSNGKRDGIATMYWPLSKTIHTQTSWDMDMRQGETKVYDESGQLTKIEMYKNNELKYITFFHEGKKIRREYFKYINNLNGTRSLYQTPVRVIDY